MVSPGALDNCTNVHYLILRWDEPPPQLVPVFRRLG